MSKQLVRRLKQRRNETQNGLLFCRNEKINKILLTNSDGFSARETERMFFPWGNVRPTIRPLTLSGSGHGRPRPSEIFFQRVRWSIPSGNPWPRAKFRRVYIIYRGKKRLGFLFCPIKMQLGTEKDIIRTARGTCVARFHVRQRPRTCTSSRALSSVVGKPLPGRARRGGRRPSARVLVMTVSIRPVTNDSGAAPVAHARPRAARHIIVLTRAARRHSGRASGRPGK